MRSSVLCTIILALLSAACSAPSPTYSELTATLSNTPTPISFGASDQDSLVSQLDQLIPQWLEEYNVPGAAVSLVRNREVVWSGGYGLADHAQSIPPYRRFGL